MLYDVYKKNLRIEEIQNKTQTKSGNLKKSVNIEPKKVPKLSLDDNMDGRRTSKH